MFSHHVRAIPSFLTLFFCYFGNIRQDRMARSLLSFVLYVDCWFSQICQILWPKMPSLYQKNFLGQYCKGVAENLMLLKKIFPRTKSIIFVSTTPAELDDLALWRTLITNSHPSLKNTMTCHCNNCSQHQGLIVSDHLKIYKNQYKFYIDRWFRH